MSTLSKVELAFLTNSHGDVLLLDVCLSDNHSFPSEITDDTVESGGNVTDNIRAKPIQITIEGLVTNTPINPTIIDERSGLQKPADEAYDFLMKIRDDREPISIRTSLRTFDSMGVENIEINRSAGRGDELRFSMTLKHIEFTSNLRTTRPATPQGKGPGTKNKPPVPFQDATARLVAIDRSTGRWLDHRINGWRAFARPGSAGMSQGIFSATGDPRVLPGFWSLQRGCPDNVLTATWANLDSPSKRALEQQLALQNMDKKPFADAETSASFDMPAHNIQCVPNSHCFISDD